MNKLEFYEALSGAPPETTDINGTVMMNKNKSKWHLCEKGGSRPTHACGSGGPMNPNTSSSFSSADYYESQFKKNADLVTPREALEKERMCKNCKRLVKDEYDLERIILAVPEEVEPDATKGEIERFIRKLSNETIK